MKQKQIRTGITVKTTLDGELILTSTKLLLGELDGSIKPLLQGAPNHAVFYPRIRRMNDEETGIQFSYSELKMSVPIELNEVHTIANLAEILNTIHNKAIYARLKIQDCFSILSKLIGDEKDESDQTEQSESHRSCAD